MSQNKSKQSLRLVGAIMALAGSLILAYAAYSFVSQKQLEAALTEQIPGQNPGPVVAMPVVGDASSPTALVPTLDPSSMSATVTPFPTFVTPVQPDETSVGHVVGTATAVSLAPRTPTKVAINSIAQPTPTTAVATLQPVASQAVGTKRGTGSPAARLQIPRLNMDLAVVTANYVTYQQSGSLYSDWDIPYDSAGHLSSTAQPGEIGNAVLSGHHNLSAPGKFGLGVFAGLWNLTVGDEILIKTAVGKTQIWRVQESFPIKEAGEPLNVRIEHARQVMGDTPAPTLTLLTCWNGKSNPLAGNTYRWVVHAELVTVS